VDSAKPERDQARRAIERKGYDRDRGVFAQAFGSGALDAALLLLPAVGFVAWDDERMVRTVDAIMEELQSDGLLLRYREPRGRGEGEGAFLACSFWLAECLARQRRLDEARTVFDRAVATVNELVLFSEEYDPEAGEMLGSIPAGPDGPRTSPPRSRWPNSTGPTSCGPEAAAAGPAGHRRVVMRTTRS
jgi:GH15 family glucan-1,4-alpha-glucosidase